MTELSIVVPLHNAERFVPTCLETIRRTIEPGFQFILIDDCSTDSTPELIADAQREIPSLTVLHNDVNIGVAASRNRAHEAVEGRYLTYFDADDWCSPQHFRGMLDAIKALNVDFVRTAHVKVTGLERRVVRVPNQTVDVPLPATSGIGAAGASSAVDYPFLWAGTYDLTRIDSSWLPFNENLRTAADRPWFWRLYMNATSTAALSQPSYFYRKTINSTALTQAGNPSTLHFTDAYDDVRELVLPTGNVEWIRKAVYATVRIVCFHIDKRERLTPELQRDLIGRSTRLLQQLPPEHLEYAVRRLPFARRMMVQRLLRAEVAAA
ncbi:glycosyltransferase family 2 protein [Demequina flava]|uniref:glycosyltransferase family 2 protein n=1 Tax=Demequina flava TaxID=1095025 RepID=UPI0007850C02|nr:glycosyltransferase family 2 protein [Demequina flava]